MVHYPLDGRCSLVEKVVLVSFLRKHSPPSLWQVLILYWLARHASGVVVLPEIRVEETVKKITYLLSLIFAKAGFYKADFVIE